MKKIIFCWLSALAFTLVAASEKIYEFSEKLNPQEVSTFAATDHGWKVAVSSTEKTPDGNAALEIHMNGAPEAAKAHGKQLRFKYHAVEVGQKYRITFWIKGSSPEKIQCIAALDTPPFQALSKRSVLTISPSPEWKKETMEFTVENAAAQTVMPRFHLGLYPTDATLWIGPVVVERLDKTFSSLYTENWLYAVEAGETLPMDRIPATAKPARLSDNRFPLEGNGAAVFYQMMEAPEDGMMTAGMAADWWFECFVNGKKAYSTMAAGNLSHKFQPIDHVFNLPVRAGQNLLAVRVKAGSNGWMFVAGRVPAQSNVSVVERLFKPVAGIEYRPVDDSRFLEIKPGTALDFSGWDGLPRPAGSLGRLIVGKTGKPVFEKHPETPVRFFGFNWTLSQMWRAQYHTWDKAKIERFADAVARRGYNWIRIHIPDDFMIGWDRWNRDRMKKFGESGFPLTESEIEEAVDKGNLDRLDYFIAAFKQRGIYVNLDLAGRSVLVSGGAWNSSHRDNFKGHLFYDAKYRKHYELWTIFLLKRINPYTRIAYKDEPAIALINFINEQDLRFSQGLDYLTPKFRAWLKNRYENNAALAKAWNSDMTLDTVPDIEEADLRKGDLRARDTGDFLIAAMREMTTWFYATVRNAGYPGLVNHWDMIMRTLEIPARALLPAVAQHVYFAHPGRVPSSGLTAKLNSPNSFVGLSPKNDLKISQQSSLNDSYFRAGAAARLFDRPYFNTEYSHSSPNRFRHERGLYFSSYAALQDWDALTVHDTTVRLNLDPFLSFDNALDPVSRVNELLAAAIYLRGDVRTAPHAVGLKLTDANMFPKHYLAAIGDDYAKLAMVTRLGVLYDDVRPLEPVGKFTPDLILEPKDFTYLSVSSWFVKADNSCGDRINRLVQQLRERGIIGKDNPTDPAKHRYVSETGEISLDGNSETMRIVTPRTEGLILKTDAPVALPHLKVEYCSRPAAIALVAIDGVKPLGEAKRALLTVNTNAYNTGQVFTDTTQTICCESGNHPALIEAVQADLVFEGLAVKEIYALHFDGTRAASLAMDGDKLHLDTSKLKYGSAVFELVLEK